MAVRPLEKRVNFQRKNFTARGRLHDNDYEFTALYLSTKKLIEIISKHLDGCSCMPLSELSTSSR